MMELLSVVTCFGSGGPSGSGKTCQLPATALQLVISSMRVSNRHGCSRSLALVCKSWAAAVAEASLEGIVLHRCADYDSFQLWLHKHGSRLQKLRANLRPIASPGLADAAVSRSQLPCPPLSVLSKLQQLDLQHAELQLSGPNSITDALAAATRLSSLRLENCAITLFQTGPADAAAVAVAVATAGAVLLAAMVQMPALQALSLCDIRVDRVLAPPLGERAMLSQHPAALPTAAIQALPGLTRLQLQGVCFDDSAAALQRISSMTGLQHLQLGGWPNRADYEHNPAWPAFADPGRAGPLHVEVSALTGLTQLRHFGLRYARLDGAAGDAADMTAQQRAAWHINVSTLLLWLPELPKLSSLQFQGVRGLCMPPEASSSLGFLTSGTTLQHIDLRGTPLSNECWQLAFPVIMKLEGVTSLMFGDNWPPPEFVADASDGNYATALQSCPNLSSVVIVANGSTATMQYVMDHVARWWSGHNTPTLWWTLGESSSLTSLSLSMKGCNELWNLRPLAKLRQLKHLHLADCSVGGSQIASLKLPRVAEDIRSLAAMSQLTFLGKGGPNYPATAAQCRETYSKIAGALDDEPSTAQLVLGDKVLHLAVVIKDSPCSPLADVCQQLQRQLGQHPLAVYAAVCLLANLIVLFVILCAALAGVVVLVITLFQSVIPGARKIVKWF